MKQSPDFVDLIRVFNAHSVDYVIVGAHALAAHGHVRATKDLDVWVRPTPANAARVMAALTEFGAPLGEVRIEDFAAPGLIFQIGVEPVRIDIVTRVDGLEFDDGAGDWIETTFGGEPTHVLSKRALLVNKRAAGRPQDLADVAALLADEKT
jgi:hypothetical protein